MAEKIIIKTKGLMVLFFILLFSSCATTISSFDQQAYIQTTSVKVDALNLMNSAKEDGYNNHIQAFQALQTNLKKIYEYEKNRPKNEITIKLWDKLLDKNGHLLGGFLERWKQGTKMSVTFVSNTEEQVEEAFDTISGLESKKIKKADIQ